MCTPVFFGPAGGAVSLVKTERPVIHTTTTAAIPAMATGRARRQKRILRERLRQASISRPRSGLDGGGAEGRGGSGLESGGISLAVGEDVDVLPARQVEAGPARK